MALISKSVSNLIGGVSQQPDAIRFDNQCDAQDNAHPSVLEGLTKRPPTEHVADITGSSSPLLYGSRDAENYFVHTINRDASHQYLSVFEATVAAENLKIVKTDGTQMTITEGSANALQYLRIHAASSLKADTALRAITIADYTFVVNRTSVISMDAATSTARFPEGLVFVKQGDYETEYSFTTVHGVDTVTQTHTSHDTDRELIQTDYIASELDDAITNFTVTREGSVIHLQSTDATDFTLTGFDGLGDTALIVLKDEAQYLTDLPTHAPHGFTIKIVGSPTDARDDYYVKFVADNGTFGIGVWEESLPAGITYKFTASTMPHVLIRKSDTEYIFSACIQDGTLSAEDEALIPLWGERNCGDVESNSDPTFATKTINDIFLFKNRLGFLADENVILSETGEFFNFWRTTVTDLLDTDPIDVASTHSTVSVLTSAIPFHKQLVLFSDQTQFLLGSGGTLTPKTVTMTKTTNYESISHIRPVSLGHSIYFGFNRGSYTGVRQYYITNDRETVFDASDISGQVPQYISGSLRDMAGSSHEDILFLLTNAQRDTLYVYKYYDRGQERLQSSWSRFIFAADDEILGIEFIDTVLYMVVKRADGVFLDKMRIESGFVDTDQSFRTHLDKRCDETVATRTYDSVADETTITMPYNAYSATPIEMMTRGSSGGLRVAIKTQTNASPTLVVEGDYSSTPYYIGQRYEMVYTLSDVVIREPSPRGGTNTITEGRIQVRYATFSYADTGYFKVEVTPDYRDTSTHPFTARILGSGNNTIGDVPLEDGDFRVPVYSKANQVTIQCKNDTPLPCSLVSAEFELSLNARSKRYA